jgi:hypothetical protein
MKTTTIATLLAALVAPAIAAIDFGIAYYTDGHQDNAIWIDGENPCDYVYLGSHTTQNPCKYNGGHFKAQNGFSYRMHGCGGDAFELFDANGDFNSKARFSPFTNAGTGCNGKAGKFHVDQQWQFGGN